MASHEIGSVSLNTLNREGFGGWWAPMEHSIGSLHLLEPDVMLVRTTTLVGSTMGRTGVILHHSPERQKQLV